MRISINKLVTVFYIPIHVSYIWQHWSKWIICLYSVLSRYRCTQSQFKLYLGFCSKSSLEWVGPAYPSYTLVQPKTYFLELVFSNERIKQLLTWWKETLNCVYLTFTILATLWVYLWNSVASVQHNTSICWKP